MALTAPRGFSGGQMADIDYGIGAAGGGWVESAAALAVTAVNGTRSVSVAAGNACGYGIRVTNDAAITQALTAPGSGGAWYLLALRFNWTTRTVTLVALPGATTGSTTTPTDIPAALPGTTNSSPGSAYDLPLAYVWTSSATTTLTIFDLRMRQVFTQILASTLQALVVMSQQSAPPVATQLPSIADGILYRWNGTGWKAWVSGWISFTPSYNNVVLDGSAAYRFNNGNVEVRGTGTIGEPASYGPFGRVKLTLPIAAAFLSIDDITGETTFNKSSEPAIRGPVQIIDATTVYLDVFNVVTRSGGSFINRIALSPTVPFAWASGDRATYRFTYATA